MYSESTIVESPKLNKIMKYSDIELNPDDIRHCKHEHQTKKMAKLALIHNPENYTYVAERFKTDTRLLSQCLMKNSELFRKLEYWHRENSLLVSIAVLDDHHNAKYALKFSSSNALFKLNPKVIQYLQNYDGIDWNEIYNLLIKYPDMMQYIDFSLLTSSDCDSLVFKLLENDPLNIKYIPDEYLDKTKTLELVIGNPNALCFVSNTLLNNELYALAAVAKNANNYFQLYMQRNNINVILTAIRTDPSIVEKILDWIVNHCKDGFDIINNNEIVDYIALNHVEYIGKIINSTHQFDRKRLLDLVKLNWKVFKYLPKTHRRDKEFVDAAINTSDIIDLVNGL